MCKCFWGVYCYFIISITFLLLSTPSRLSQKNLGGNTQQEISNPKDTSGLTFGDNGFYLDFADSSDLGNDVSGNNNDWTAKIIIISRKDRSSTNKKSHTFRCGFIYILSEHQSIDP